MIDTTAAAQRLLDLVKAKGYLDHATAVDDLERHFGAEAVVINDAGNQAIAPKILTAFRRISEGTVVWDRSDLLWRLRANGDLPGRMQS